MQGELAQVLARAHLFLLEKHLTQLLVIELVLLGLLLAALWLYQQHLAEMMLMAHLVV